MIKIQLLAPLLLALLLSSCSKSPDDAIEEVLNECASISGEANSTNMSSAQAAEYLAREFQGVDVRDCPPEFRVAFQQHVTAWREAVPYFATNVALNTFLEGFYGGYTGNYSGVGNSAAQVNAAIQRINSTYNQLTQIAANYGARIPHSANNR